MDSQLLNFVDLWIEIDDIVAVFLIVFAAILLAVYRIKLSSIPGLAEKYAFVSRNEKRYLWYSSLAIVLAIVFLVNAFITGHVRITAVREVYFIGFISLIVGVALSYALYATINFYYPFYLEKRLNFYRFKTRISPDGKELRLLNEDEEDLHMTPEMIAEEESFAYDYDVWLDDETGYKLIEKYDGHLHALVCDNCHFRTMKDYKEEIILQPTEEDAGTVKRYYKCSYCGHHQEKMVTVAQLEAH